MNQKINIREFIDQDKDAVLVLLRLNTPAFFAPEEERDLIDYLDHERELYYVLEADGKIVGCGGINFDSDGKVGKISWDIIHPDFQGKALGSKLLNYRLDKLEFDLNVKSIIVRTSQKSFRFYEKNGFELKEIIKDFWAKGFDLYLMEYKF